jgi:hypothetical protein
VRFFQGLAVLVMMLAAGCSYVEVEQETGYKGRARVNPWLAAERFAEELGQDVWSLGAWQEPEEEDALWFVPGFILSNESFTRRMEQWVLAGGHLVVLLEHSDSQRNDWRRHRAEAGLSQALRQLLERAGIGLEELDAAEDAAEVEYLGKSFRVEASATTRVSAPDQEAGVFASAGHGAGRMTVLADARIFRNRWIDGEQHADLLAALLDGVGEEQWVVFLRGVGLSFLGMLWQYLWPVLLALAVLMVLWLWKNLSRFGPLESRGDAPPLPAYERHLEALGDFQWRLDGGNALLRPLRERLIEHGQHLAARAGHHGGDSLEILAERSGLPRERVVRALVDPAPRDGSAFTRIAADLQRISQSTNPHVP